MATRFYFDTSVDPTTIPHTIMTQQPAFDAGWEVTGLATFTPNILRPKQMLSIITLLGDAGAVTVPITTTQDILWEQFISDPIAGGVIAGTFSIVVRVFESATTANVTLAVSVRVCSGDGRTIRGTLYTNFNADTEFALSASAATRIVNAGSITPVTAYPGDRIVVEIGGHAAAPTAATSYTVRVGYNAASDFALTTALTTDLNPWCEFSQNLFTNNLNNYQFVKAPDGISVTEKIR